LQRERRCGILERMGKREDAMNTEFFDKNAASWDQKRERGERAKKIYGLIAGNVTLAADAAVLDFGCGTGLLGLCFADGRRRVTFADTSAGMLREVEAKLRENSVRDLQSPGCSVLDLSQAAITADYDLIVSLLAFHHVEDIDSTLAALASRVKPAGWIALSDLDVEDGSFHAPEVVPHNGIDRAPLAAALREKGFTVVFDAIVHTNEKMVGGKKREYPVFLLIARKGV
jgi:2-polyprenyl-3-methyl-5-hydroxy-6-metoxy-1,4-benzoquinol methylase